jgi:hypothetical protein
VRLACLWRNGASRSYREVNENLAREHSRDDEDFDVKQIKTIKEKTTREALIDAPPRARQIPC